MKTILTLIAAALMGAATFAQKISESQVPAVVVKTFQTKFGAISGVKWEMENANAYEGAFTQNKQKMTATFDKEGRWLETETVMDPSKVPQAVLQAISKQFGDYKLKEVV